ncbi:MAG: lipoate--protein ligase family protein [Acidiferrobacter sp.]
MSGAWRRLDTGVRTAAENMALDRTLLESRQAGAPNTLRFLRFRPSALIGFHQSARQELHLDYCRAHQIAVSRRVTGGGALYCDEGQVGWELFLDRTVFAHADMLTIAADICGMAVAGLRTLGIDAAFRPRNDIEVEGRKIGGTGGAFDGAALLYQGTVLIDFNVERMLKVLRIPQEKLADKALSSARERITTLREVLGQAPTVAAVQAALTQAFAAGFGVDLPVGALTAAEQQTWARHHAEIASDAWVYETDRPQMEMATVSAMRKTEGGLVRVMLRIDQRCGRVKQAFITGDFFVSPQRTICDLEGALRDVACEQVEEIVMRFFATHPTQMLLLTPADIAGVLTTAITGPAAQAL